MSSSKRLHSCNCGKEVCMEIRRKWRDRGDNVMSGHTTITYGMNTKPLRVCVARHLKFAKEFADSLMDTWHVANIHWPPALMAKNRAEKRKLSVPISREESRMYNCHMDEAINSWGNCSLKAGGQMPKDKMGMYVQAPCYPLTHAREDVNFRSTGCHQNLRLVTPVPFASPTPLLSRATPNLDHLVMSVTEGYTTPTKKVASVATIQVSSPEILPSTLKLHSFVKRRYEAGHVTDSIFKHAMETLVNVHQCHDPIVIRSYPQLLLYPCRGLENTNVKKTNQETPCLLICERSKRNSEAGLLPCCTSCTSTIRSLWRHKDRKLKDTDGKRVAFDSHVKILALSPGEKTVRMANLTQEYKKQRRSIQRLEAANEKMEIDSSRFSSSMRTSIEKVFANIARLSIGEKTDMKTYIVECLLDVTSREESTQQQAEEYAAYLVGRIENKAKQLGGEDAKLAYSSKDYQLAMTLYLRSTKGYKQQREMSLDVMPSITSLKKIQRATRVTEGVSPKTYGWFFDEYVDTTVSERGTSVCGMVMCDEMKLDKTGFYWRASDDMACGLISGDDTNDLRSVLRDMLLDDEGGFEGLYQPATYVNQWRFRSTYGTVHNSEYFFNCGSLGGDELLRQLLHVIVGYESQGVHIYMVEMDAGGGNAGLIKLLRDGERPPIDAIKLSEDMVSFVNPYDPTRRIACLCSTHDGKALRNQLYGSNFGKGKRKFCIGDISFGWQSVVDIFFRDEARFARGYSRVTGLKHTVSLT